ncbi:MAG: hypothetical protein IPN60_06515 [Saprospiraceae bacterium]|nr:hypothetical protein [Candidatus Opimibacter skivensis]MBL0006789.1 hypothetical protein [Candidatus Opimibacter skivensis]
MLIPAGGEDSSTTLSAAHQASGNSIRFADGEDSSTAFTATHWASGIPPGEAVVGVPTNNHVNSCWW